MRSWKIIFVITLLNLALYAAPGDLDDFFGTSGKVVTPIGTGIDEAKAIALQQDGKIVVGGLTVISATETDFALVRYNLDGSIDTTFGSNGNGIVITDVDAQEEITAIEVLSDGSILVAGSTISLRGDFIVAKYDSSGVLDNTFGTNGITITEPPPSDASHDLDAKDMLVASDGKIYVVGTRRFDRIFGNPDRFEFAAARYNANGTLDTTYGFNGIGFALSGSSFNGQANAAALQSDGKLVVVGGETGNFPDFMLVRFNQAGSRDSAFSGDGILIDAVAGASSASGVHIKSDGKILVAGHGAFSNGVFALVQYSSSGTPETTVTSDVADGETVSAMEIQADSKIVVVGTGSNGATGNDFTVLRYNDDLTLDNSFASNTKSFWGTNGVANADFSGNSDEAFAVAIDGAGRVTVAGAANNGTNNDFAVARFLNFGPTDANATISGKVISPNGRGISNTIVLLTEQSGNTKTARTNHFGYYKFDDVEVGQTVILNAYSKQYQFNTQVINFDKALTDINIFAQQNQSKSLKRR